LRKKFTGNLFSYSGSASTIVIAIRPASPSNSLAIALKSSASPGVFKSANTATLTVPRHVLAVRGSADLARSIVAGEYRHTSDIVKFDVVSSLAFASSRVRLHLRRPRAALAAVAATTTIHAQVRDAPSRSRVARRRSSSLSSAARHGASRSRLCDSRDSRRRACPFASRRRLRIEARLIAFY
jgi:hypothetical protein